MWRASSLTIVLLAVVLSGCVGVENDPAGPGDPEALVAFALAGAESAGNAVLYAGTRLVGAAPDAASSRPPFMAQVETPPCDATNCETVALEIVDTGGRSVAISIEWEGQDESWPTLAGPGYYLGDAKVRLDAVVLRDGSEVLDVVESSHYGGVGVLADPEPGLYEVQTVAARGSSSYFLTVRVQDEEPFVDEAKDGELLPDLVALPPDHPTFRMPFAHEAGTPLGDTFSGCGPDETVEAAHLRCLRFAGIIGNQGAGDFLTVLEYDDAQASIAGSGGNWQQVIKSVDGSERLVEIGPAHYHEVHGHFHIIDFVATQLYEYDTATETRGQAVGDGRKMGFCVIDGGLIDTLAPAVPPQYNGAGCCYIIGICQIDMLTFPRFEMGMSPNWYDIYPWWRSEQYVEVSALPDGVYELVTVINPDGLIEEADHDNNEASSVLRVSGGAVELVSMRTDAKLGPHPDADWGYATQQQAEDEDEEEEEDEETDGA